MATAGPCEGRGPRAPLAARLVFGVAVHGVGVDAATRCAHYRGPTDVIALRFKCCGRWYPCRQCHDQAANHDAAVWPQAERDARAVLCGVCGHRLRIDEYLASGARCTACGADFNPRCAGHYHLYFEMPGPVAEQGGIAWHPKGAP